MGDAHLTQVEDCRDQNGNASSRNHDGEEEVDLGERDRAEHGDQEKLEECCCSRREARHPVEDCREQDGRKNAQRYDIEDGA